MDAAASASGGAPPVILFLQGPPTLFWSRLAGGLERAGARVLKVTLSAGDQLFWRRAGARAYRGSFAGWPAWLEGLIADEGVTDILYYADQQPYHVAARAIAERWGLRAWAVEFGYLRPDWLTLEPGGMGAQSDWPRDPGRIRALARGAPAPDFHRHYAHNFPEEALCDVLYNMATVLGWPLYPRFRSDRYRHPVIDYLAWLAEFTREGRQAREAALVERAAAERAWPFALVALQLQSDYQIRASTGYNHLAEMLDEILTSFAEHAPGDHRLVIKVHPLDHGLERWPARVADMARACGVAGRVHVIKGGDLGVLINEARGVVLANSTVGLHALQAGVPVKTLGSAIYDVAGLTHQGALDTFWTAPEPVDRDLAGALFSALARHIQVKGSFYNRRGQDAAIKEFVRRLTGEHQCLSS